MPIVTPRTWVAGDVLTAAQMNVDVRDNVTFLANPPACRVGNSANQTLVDSVGLNVAFNTERWDTNTMHDNVTLNTRITIRTAGLYLFTFTGLISVGTADYLSVKTLLMVNGAPVSVNSIGSYADAAGDIYLQHTTVWKGAVNDYAEIQVVQNNSSNTSRVLAGAQAYSPEFAATWIGLG